MLVFSYIITGVLIMSSYREVFFFDITRRILISSRKAYSLLEEFLYENRIF